MEHTPVDEVPADANVILCHVELKGCAAAVHSDAALVSITDFLNAPDDNVRIEALKME